MSRGAPTLRLPLHTSRTAGPQTEREFLTRLTFPARAGMATPPLRISRNPVYRGPFGLCLPQE